MSIVGPLLPDARVLDLICHLPYDTIGRRARPKIIDAEIGTQVVLDVRVTDPASCTDPRCTTQ